ncbi:hypothetical protein H9Q69_006384 [Fusarium xylarioides]|nr:hypothetical protein H9Q69_006384 [Fusarium xylarioides]KAG5804212.1 hypothetical protein H9Q71_011202 [Fusarium xylarioides]KAG5809614.1 hypothetical protein H9Q74_014216 [Fusarium xylarioides]
MEFDRSRDFRSLMKGKPGRPDADNFGRQNSRPRSLLLDMVTQGRPRASSCKLLQLPAEILAEIVDSLDDTTSLESLAEVNSDCLQLAYCSYFAQVTFDYSLETKELASNLVEDKKIRAMVSPCIRKVIFASHPHHVADTHRELYEAFYHEEVDSVTDEQAQVLYDEACEEYVAARAAAVEAILSLPNLETLIWKDQFSLDKNFFEKITRCSARYIELDGPAIDDAWSLTPPLTPSTWPLRSLKLDVSLAQGGTHPMTRFFSTLFHLCSPTLESLTWTSSGVTRDNDVLASIGETAVEFPHLRYLKFQSVELDNVAISSFLAAPLKSLELDEMVVTNPSASNFEPLRDLEDFAVSHPPQKASACRRIAKFISEHTGLRKLYLQESLGGAKYLNDTILPTLIGLDFGNLKSLHLAWGTTQIPDKSLRMIARLVSLEQLSLSAGRPCEWQHYWDVDHDKLRHHLSRLQRLTKLALSHDTYPSIDGTLPSGFYYLCPMPPQSVEEANARPELDGEEIDSRVDYRTMWERMHRNRMLDEAEEYADVFPKLQWMFCGQRPMGFIRTPEGQDGSPKAVPLTKERDQCRTHLAEVFRGSRYMSSHLTIDMDCYEQ